RTKHGPYGSGPGLPQVRVARSNQLHSSVPNVIGAQGQSEQSAIDAQTELLAVWIHQIGSCCQKNRRRYARAEAEWKNVGSRDRAVAKDVSLFRKSPDLRRRSGNPKL